MPASQAGKQGKCPSCKQPVRIPAATAVPDARPPQKSRTPTRPLQVHADAPAPEGASTPEIAPSLARAERRSGQDRRGREDENTARPEVSDSRKQRAVVATYDREILNKPLEFPSMCACCTCNDKLRWTGTHSPWTEEFRFDNSIPYCEDCLVHVRKNAGIAKDRAIIAVILGFLGPLMFGVIVGSFFVKDHLANPSYGMSILVGGLAFACACVGGMRLLGKSKLREPVVPPGHTAWLNAFWCVHGSKTLLGATKNISFAMTNFVFAGAFFDANPVSIRSITEYENLPNDRDLDPGVKWPGVARRWKSASEFRQRCS